MRASNSPNWFTVPALLAVISIGCFLYRYKIRGDIQRSVDQKNYEYDNRIQEGKETMKRVLDQWSSAKQVVEEFDETTETNIVA